MASFGGVEPFESAWAEVRVFVIDGWQIWDVWVEVADAVPFGDGDEGRFVVFVVFDAEDPVMVGLAEPIVGAPVDELSVFDWEADETGFGDAGKPVETGDWVANVFQYMGNDGEVEGSVGFELSPDVFAVYITDVESLVGIEGVDIHICVDEFVCPWVVASADIDNGVVGVGCFVATDLIEHLGSEGVFVAVGVVDYRHVGLRRGTFC